VAYLEKQLEEYGKKIENLIVEQIRLKKKVAELERELDSFAVHPAPGGFDENPGRAIPQPEPENREIRQPMAHPEDPVLEDADDPKK